MLKLYFPAFSDVMFHLFSLRVVHITPSMENELIQAMLFILSQRFINFPSNAFMCDSMLVNIVNGSLIQILQTKGVKFVVAPCETDA